MKPILEVNAAHPLIASLARRLPVDSDKSLVEHLAWLASTRRGCWKAKRLRTPPPSPARLRRVMEKASRVKAGTRSYVSATL